MKTLTKSRAAIGLLATIGFFSLQSLSHSAEMRDPVCSTARDVGNVFGRDSAPRVAPHCLVERKVSVPRHGLDVSSILGNRNPVSRIASPADISVNARSKSDRTVEYVLGRAGGIEFRSRGYAADTLALPDQH